MFKNLKTESECLSLADLENTLFHLTESEFREKVQILSAHFFKDTEILSTPPPEYRTLLSLCRRFYNRKDFPRDAAFMPCNLSALCDDLAFCTDLCSPKTIVCFQGAAEVHAVILPRAMRWAILNLIRFALDQKNAYITLSLEGKDHFVKLGLHANALSPADFQNALLKDDSGISFAMRTAKLHGGTLFFRQEINESAVFLCFAPQDSADANVYTMETFDELLSDRFSPLYAALLG